MVIWTLQENPVTDATINLKAEPFSDRSLDPSLRFSSYTSGDPITPLLRAYPGDPVVIRSIHVGPNVDSFRVDGHKFYTEKRMPSDPSGTRKYSRVSDTIQSGVSERFTLMLDGGAGGVRHIPGDYLYHDGVARRFRQGAWGIIRVLGAQAADLQPLPGYPAPGGTYVQPAVTGGRPPVTTDPGNPCPAGSPQKSFAVSAVDVPSTNVGSGKGPRAAYVLSSAASSVKKNGVTDPLVLHVAEGDCVEVKLKNERSLVRASFSVAELAKSASSGASTSASTRSRPLRPGRPRRTGSSPTSGRSKARSWPTSAATRPARSVSTVRSSWPSRARRSRIRQPAAR